MQNCSGQFSDLSCLRKDQWVGGIEYIDHPRQPWEFDLKKKRNFFNSLSNSKEIGEPFSDNQIYGIYNQDRDTILN